MSALAASPEEPALSRTASSGGYAPIAVFAYRRVEMLGQVLDALEACPEFSASPVYVFSDGPKTQAHGADVAAVRAAIRGRLRPNMQLVEADRNQGLAASIISGVNRLCEEYGRVIVMEDDLISSPLILNWFNQALQLYRDDARVMQISGFMFKGAGSNKRAAFMPIVSSWGWATWTRAWTMFDPAARDWERLYSSRALLKKFDLDGAYPYSKMLKQQDVGKSQSWAVRWYWAVFKSNGLVLYPGQTLIKNVGQDAAATNVGIYRRLLARVRSNGHFPLVLPDFPDSIELTESVFRRVKFALGLRLI